jgi:Tfp pilus assembly protein PilF
MKRGFVLLTVLFLVACATPPQRPLNPGLFNDTLFNPPSQLIDTAEVFRLSDAMRQYMATNLSTAVRRYGVQQGLIHVLYRSDELKLGYDASRTRNAAETFAARRGNCLSLVIMTAAIAKELGLTVDYRSADIEQTWHRRGDLVFASGHVNLTLGRRLIDHHQRGGFNELTIDFLPADELRGLRTVSVSEATVLAMYMNNRAAEALARDELDDAYAWVREALRNDPGFANAYNTLGVVYQRHGNPALAAGALREALARNPDHPPVMANLARALELTGQAGDAAALRERLAKLQPFPPYYFFDLGQQAMQRGDYQAARDWFAKEVARADSSAEFHYWLGLAHYKLGHLDAAQSQLDMAARNGQTPEDRALYAAKLTWLKHARAVQ